MDEQNKLNVGTVIRAERQKLGLSLSEAEKRTGVSKAMLGQIEREESSPTLSTVWKIAVGLHIPISTLLTQNESAEYRVTALSDLKPVSEKHGKIRVYSLFPFDPVVGLDYLYIEIQPGMYYPSTGHTNAQAEYVVVTQGELTMHIAGKPYCLKTGDSISFAGGEEHGYENCSDALTVFQCVVRY